MKSLLAHYDSGSGSEEEPQETEDMEQEDEDKMSPVIQEEEPQRSLPHSDDEFSGEDDPIDKIRDPIEYHRMLIGKKPEEIKIPRAPRGAVDALIMEKMMRLKEKKESRGMDMKLQIQKRKDFRNPSIYEKLIDHCAIDEFGSNFPPETFDPHAFEADSFYEKLSLAQKLAMDSSQAKDAVSSCSASSSSQSDKPKVVEIITGTAKKASSSSNPTSTSTLETKRKKQSKWDAAPSTKPKLND